MTTATASTPIESAILDVNAQALIDSRLDTIERMLLGQVPRADRLAIVREVEAQIHDHLAERHSDDTDRDAVLAALGRLDPPEAYLPEEGSAPPRVLALTRGPLAARPESGSTPAAAYPGSTMGKLAGILGLVGIGLGLLAGGVMFLDFLVLGTEFLGLGATAVLGLAGVIGLQAIIFAACARLIGVWPVVGLTTGIITVLGSLSGVSYISYILLS